MGEGPREDELIEVVSELSEVVKAHLS